jgi:YidC/Oxa1 family membrane protein insertase
VERRFILFLVLSFGVLVGYSWLMQKLNPPPPRPVAAKDQPPPADGDKAADAADKKPDGKSPEKPAEKPEPKPEQEKPGRPAVKAPDEPEPPELCLTLGSADPDQKKNPYRMLVTLTNRGAAVARIELSSSRYCDIDHRWGYLGNFTAGECPEGNGCPVRVVGAGTPAAEAGLKPGDLIQALDDRAVSGPQSLDEALSRTRPGQKVKLKILRDGNTEMLTATLRRRPVEVVRPEADDPLSMLLTLRQIDEQKLSREDPKAAAQNAAGNGNNKNLRPRAEFIERELPGVRLRTANWQLVESDESHAVFSRKLPEFGLEIIKTYRLARAPDESIADADYPAYHLEFSVEIRNIGEEARQVAYQLDGPNGLPTEGKWYAYKVSRNWGAAGLRDFVISLGGGVPGMVGAAKISTGDVPSPWPDHSLSYIGVDAQYFSAVLMPIRENAAEPWYEDLLPICVGESNREHLNLANTSCRLISAAKKLAPGESLQHRLKLFAGPKRPPLLENSAYNLGELVYYGWPIFSMVAVPLTKLLHILYAGVFNYGLAIILLTALVRGCMFPLSRKQVIGAQKMQQLQPEIKKIQQLHKNNVEARTKAQQELFRKHNYNPLSGCLPIFIQMPVFIGLYRALMVDIELRDAPLLTHAVRWCSNLAAPDMLVDWHRVMPDWVNSGAGIFGLGPYFNLLPILTIVLFIFQQKMFMPPPTDEQSAMQQKVMQYMMIFMGVLFFKVASGLCIYFIVSSLWGLAERQFMPKPAPVAAAPETRAEAKARARLAAAKPKK